MGKSTELIRVPVCKFYNEMLRGKLISFKNLLSIYLEKFTNSFQSFITCLKKLLKLNLLLLPTSNLIKSMGKCLTILI